MNLSGTVLTCRFA